MRNEQRVKMLIPFSRVRNGLFLLRSNNYHDDHDRGDYIKASCIQYIMTRLPD